MILTFYRDQHTVHTASEKVYLFQALREAETGPYTDRAGMASQEANELAVDLAAQGSDFQDRVRGLAALGLMGLGLTGLGLSALVVTVRD
ncbi:hypothetical protein ACPW7N_17200 [Brevibacillus sp. SYSU BS000544]